MTIYDERIESNEATLPVGQLYFPSVSEYNLILDGVFERRYFTNHGPSASIFEDELAKFLGVRHVIATNNATIALAMLLKASGFNGEVIVPSFTFIATVDAILWSGNIPVFVDIADDSHHVSADTIRDKVSKNTKGILVPNLWGGCSPVDEISDLAQEYNIPLFFDSAQAFGCEYQGERLGGYGTGEVFSFHATKVLSAGEGGCIATNDDSLAKKLRNMRSSYGAGEFIEVPVTSNARISELQAEVGRWSLCNFARHQRNNSELRDLYKEVLGTIEGVRLIEPENVTFSNFQYLTVELDESAFGLSRDDLANHLQSRGIVARRYFFPGIHHVDVMQEFVDRDLHLPRTDSLCRRVMQLPLGAVVEKKDVERIGHEIVNAKSCKR